MRSKFVFIVIILGNFVFNQSETQQFDRKRWNELRQNLKYKKSSFSEKNQSVDENGWDDNWIYSSDEEGRNEGEKLYDRGNSGDSYKRSSSRKNSESESSDFNPSGLGDVAQLVLIVLAILSLVFILYKVLFASKEKLGTASIEEQQEEFDLNTIQQSELELQLERALASENYRKCIRIYFSFVLKELSENGTILWERDKTNKEYLAELKKVSQADHFQYLMEIYEVVWYGKRELNLQQYDQIEPEFKKYLNQISVDE